MHLFLATSWLDPIVRFMQMVVEAIHHVVPSWGWSLVVLALLIRVVFWPLNVKQFKSMIAMQKIAPQLKALQKKYGKSDPPRYQKETMELYKSAGANPLAGCWPMLIQYPFIIAVFYMVTEHKELYQSAHFLWIGTPLSIAYPQIFASSLTGFDWPFLVLYAVSMYVSVRFTTMPVTDPSQVGTQKIMQIASPLMIGFFAFKAHWPSAMIVYWFAYNVFTMAQQFYLLRRYHQPLRVIDSDYSVIEDADLNLEAGVPAPKALGSGKATSKSNNSKSNKKKKGASK